MFCPVGVVAGSDAEELLPPLPLPLPSEEVLEQILGQILGPEPIEKSLCEAPLKLLGVNSNPDKLAWDLGVSGGLLRGADKPWLGLSSRGIVPEKLARLDFFLAALMPGPANRDAGRGDFSTPPILVSSMLSWGSPLIVLMTATNLFISRALR